MLVAIQNESGEIKVYERVEVIPDRFEYRAVPCDVIDISKRRVGLGWKAAAIVGAVWIAQFSADKVFDFVFQTLLVVAAR